MEMPLDLHPTYRQLRLPDKHLSGKSGKTGECGAFARLAALHLPGRA